MCTTRRRLARMIRLRAPASPRRARPASSSSPACRGSGSARGASWIPRASFDHEPPQSLRPFAPALLEPLDPGGRRAATHRFDQLGESVTLPFGLDLERAVGTVSHPAREPQLAGDPGHEVAETDTLDP